MCVSDILQWQVVLFIQGLLLIDADLTSSVGALSIGVSLLLLNIFMILVIGVGAHETVRRASTNIKQVSRQLSSSGLVKMVSGLKGPHHDLEVEVDVELEVEMCTISSNDEGQQESVEVGVENPLHGWAPERGAWAHWK